MDLQHVFCVKKKKEKKRRVKLNKEKKKKIVRKIEPNQEEHSSPATSVIPVSSCKINCVLRAILAENSVGKPIASSNAFV